MKFLIIFTLLVIGFCHAEQHGERSTATRGVLKRVVKRAIGGMGGEFLTETEVSIIANCKNNGHKDVGDELQASYDKLKICLRKKMIFIDSKEDYIANMEECAQDSIKKTEACLADNQKYFPQFILELAKSVVSFMYEDFEIMRINLPSCIQQFQNIKVQRKYLSCLVETAQKTHDSVSIPPSKEAFCEKFIPASRCFTDVIKDECNRSPKLDKFREDYMNAMLQPCGLKNP